MVVSETLTVDRITKCLANEATVEIDLTVGGTLLIDTIDTSLASQLSIKDTVVVGSTTANKNLTANGTLDVFNCWAPKPWVGFLV